VRPYRYALSCLLHTRGKSAWDTESVSFSSLNINETSKGHALTANTQNAGKGRQPFLTHYWRAESVTPLAGLVSDLLDTLQARETRQRARSLRAEADWREAFEAAICALARHVLTADDNAPLVSPLANARSRRSRYDTEATFSAGKLCDAIEALGAGGVVSLSRAKRQSKGGEASTIAATDSFRSMLGRKLINGAVGIPESRVA